MNNRILAACVAIAAIVTFGVMAQPSYAGACGGGGCKVQAPKLILSDVPAFAVAAKCPQCKPGKMCAACTAKKAAAKCTMCKPGKMCAACTAKKAAKCAKLGQCGARQGKCGKMKAMMMKDLDAIEVAIKAGKKDEALKLVAAIRSRCAAAKKGCAVRAKGGRKGKAKGCKGRKCGPKGVINTKCPIMGNKIDPGKVPAKLTRMHKGRKVGFCCGGCPASWDKLSDEAKDAKLKANADK